MDLDEPTKVAIVNTMRELNCCPRCIIMYLGVRTPEPYREPESYLEKIVSDLSSEIPAAKKQRTTPCRVCMGIVEDDNIQNILEMPLDVPSYSHKDFVFVLSVPKAHLIRDHSMFLYMKQKFPSTYDNRAEILHLKNVFHNTLVEAFGKKINKEHDKDSSLSAIININYDQDEEECFNMKSLANTQDAPSKTLITRVLGNTDLESFKKHYKVPADPPEGKLDVNISIASGISYLGGRYLKFSRDMGQTPWIIDDEPMTEFCVSGIIFDSIEKILGYSKDCMKFSSSGREDSDVRMLGNGRPFYIQVTNAKNIEPTFEQLRAVEEDIIKSNRVAVIRFQPVSASDVKMVKTGEESKAKNYTALCITKRPIEEAVPIINSLGRLEIDQLTPFRVLHRRTLSVRKKIIYEIKARAIPGEDNLFLLDLVTQAGTYVKEFVHGDFHRTRPNITQILEQPTDIVALDVTKVDLDFPVCKNSLSS